MRALSVSAGTVAVMLFLAPAVRAQEQADCPGPTPLLTVADFNGDGIVEWADLNIINEARSRGEYIAFFDRNADGQLNGQDVTLAIADGGKASTPLDQEIAAVFWATVHLRNQDNAIAEGWIPITQEFAGHGVHWGNLADGRFDRTFDPAQPEGLNYSADGKLLAVYYFHGPHFSSADLPPEGFTGDEDQWHHHAGACFGGVDPAAPTYDPAELNYLECVTPMQCYSATGSRCTIWLPKFHMLHLWLYELNPCGKFAMTHPDHGTPGEHAMCEVEDVLP